MDITADTAAVAAVASRLGDLAPQVAALTGGCGGDRTADPAADRALADFEARWSHLLTEVSTAGRQLAGMAALTAQAFTKVGG